MLDYMLNYLRLVCPKHEWRWVGTCVYACESCGTRIAPRLGQAGWEFPTDGGRIAMESCELEHAARIMES